jgi:hypothetical protein
MFNDQDTRNTRLILGSVLILLRFTISATSMNRILTLKADTDPSYGSDPKDCALSKSYLINEFREKTSL